ncbi:peptidoglycan bridge formation glycyltransferase FemA/FemB family protein [Flaviflexus equikiangi]|uniref:Peptidoglycan bridge formation glycyltransferase FemA/FemB family protein n=1 Tax=Flaviflexus equikiangi TaxID=2758573 RepID=A0ABS2TCA5_9ACTO|nr:peptidoglycan bridge formation glycyltransferase FemA/FemB family protein [Flaviflexus equikiangi]MBM9432256.1 peptidoglycan bridge formation glycyltransferase FemA/FemB family protein [Flaviflexus equikiangi]
MRFTRLSQSAYARFVHDQERVLFPQLPGYAAERRSEGTEIHEVGVVETIDGEERVIAAALVRYQPWKKVFKRANIAYGPVMDYSRPDLVRFFFDHLISYLKKDRAMVALRFNPLLAERFYEDITPVADNPVADVFAATMAELGISRLRREFYESADIQARFFYTKDISGMTFADVTKSVGQVVRTGFNRAGTPGVEVRFLEADEFHILNDILSHTADRSEMQEISDHAMAFYQGMKRVEPENVFAPVAVLNCDDYLAGIAAESAELSATIARIDEQEKALAGEGKNLAKKQRTARNEAQERLNVLGRRAAETREHRDRAGNEIVLAGSLFIACPNELVYLLSGSYREYQSYYGIYLVHRAMLEWASANGIDRYNTFGITGIFTDDASDAGVLHFKRQFKGDVEELVGTWETPIRPRLAKALSAIG